MGFSCDLFEQVMTSGEAFWLDVKSGHMPEKRFFFVEGAQGDADLWTSGRDITVFETPEAAEVILMIGVSKNAATEMWQDVLNYAMKANLKVYCVPAHAPGVAICWLPVPLHRYTGNMGARPSFMASLIGMFSRRWNVLSVAGGAC